MTEAVYIFSEALKAVLYLLLFLDLSSRIMPWIGAEDTNAGRALDSLSEFISFPFTKLMKRFTDRYPLLDRVPQAMGTVLIYILAVSVP